MADKTSVLVMLFIGALGGRRPVLFWLQYFGGAGLAQAFDAIELWWLGYWAEQYTLRDHGEVSVG